MSVPESVTIPNVLANDDGIRPAGNPDECFYCQQKVGTPHKETCVCVNKKVKIRAIVEYEVEVPFCWDKEDIEFHRNEGSWCASNLIDELSNIDHEGEDDICLCGIAKFEFVEVTVPGPYVKEGGV